MNCLFWLFLLFCCGGNCGGCDTRACEKSGCKCSERREESDCRERVRRDTASVNTPSWKDDCPCDGRKDSMRNESKWQDSRMMSSSKPDFSGYGRGETCGCEDNA